MKRTLLVAVALVLAGCSANTIDEPTEAATAASQPNRTTTEAATPTAPTSPRGNLIKAFGEEAGLGCATETCDVEFVLDAPTPATECDGTYSPKFGELLAFPVRVETQPGANMQPFGGMWNPNSFSALIASGVTVPGITSAAAYGCAESDRTIPDSLSPASVYEGFVVLDVPTDATALIFQPNSLGGQGGWEWEL